MVGRRVCEAVPCVSRAVSDIPSPHSRFLLRDRALSDQLGGREGTSSAGYVARMASVYTGSVGALQRGCQTCGTISGVAPHGLTPLFQVGYSTHVWLRRTRPIADSEWRPESRLAGP